MIVPKKGAKQMKKSIIKMYNIRKNTGITLIALVITIIILIILAAITINAVFGENGLILRAQESKFKTEVSGIKDLVAVKKLEIEADKQLHQPTQNLSAYLDSLNIPEYIGPNKLVIDVKKKLAYNSEGEFNTQQKNWLEQIGIYAAEVEEEINWRGISTGSIRVR